MRKRINKVAVASSENYKRSRELHIEYLKEQHRKNEELFEKIEINTSFRTIRVFGKEIIISEEEIKTHKTIIKWI